MGRTKNAYNVSCEEQATHLDQLRQLDVFLQTNRPVTDWNYKSLQVGS